MESHLDQRYSERLSNDGGEPGATAQRPQLSRSVLAQVLRRPGSWLIWGVWQNNDKSLQNAHGELR